LKYCTLVELIPSVADFSSALSSSPVEICTSFAVLTEEGDYCHDGSAYLTYENKSSA